MENAKHPFSADRPITSCANDLLGRCNFAKSIAAAIRGWTGSDSLVVALFGPWGSGKTSIKNMAVETLRSSEETCPLIVEFNPWQWAGQEQLADAFFTKLVLFSERIQAKKAKKGQQSGGRMQFILRRVHSSPTVSGVRYFGSC